MHILKQFRALAQANLRLNLVSLGRAETTHLVIYMPLSISEMLGMRMRGTPVGRMRQALRRAADAGLPIGSDLMEVHLLAGGNLERVLDALILAKQEGLEADWLRLTAFDLTGTDPVAAVRRSIPDQELVFDQYAADRPEKILGFCTDGSAVRAACRVMYRLPLLPDATPLLSQLQERLSARIAVLINTAPDPRSLEARKSERETHLLAMAHEIMPRVRAVQLRFASGARSKPAA